MKKMVRRNLSGKYRLLLLAVSSCLIFFSGCGKETSKAVRKDKTILSEAGERDFPAIETESSDFEEMPLEMETETDISKEAGKTGFETALEAPEIISEEVKPVQTSPQAGKRTLLNLLLTAKKPLGHTMYIWGGGWNEEDTAAGEEARSIGESPRWKEFSDGQNASYDYNNTRYQIHDGLDCSGYVGWIIYNVFETTDGEEGYVEKATGMAKSFSDRGWGNYTPAGQVTDRKPGDIMSMKGHVWISLGTCTDGSVVLLHASPPGVILSGTTLSDGSKSRAVELAEYYMQTCYPDWYAKYPDCAKDAGYLSKSAQMRWNPQTLDDEEQVQEMGAEEVLQILFSY